MGRKPHAPTDASRAQVFALSSFGVNQDEIGAFMDLSDDTLRKYYAAELQKAKTDRNAEVAAFLFRAASGALLSAGASHADCLKAAMFWMKTRAQWRETTQISNDPDNPLTITVIERVIVKAANPDA